MNPAVSQFPHARILVVDDEPTNLILVRRLLMQSGYPSPLEVQDSRLAVQTILEQKPDLVLLDLMMPHVGGLDVLKSLSEQKDSTTFIPVIVLTADNTTEARHEALALGAMDFITKPIDRTETLLRIKNTLHLQHLHQKLSQHNQSLEQQVFERTHDLQLAYEQIVQHNHELHLAHQEIVERLARCGEYRDDQTGDHTDRVGHMAVQIGQTLGMLEPQLALLEQAAKLHDIGKVGIPDHILLKPGRLTPEEFEVIKQHVQMGANILQGSKTPVLQMAERIALSHHERWDGKGYPQGLSGEAIPLEARIVSVCDVYDALTSERPYKKAWTHEEALQEILSQSSKMFDPEVVHAFLACIKAPLTAHAI
ncbi:HD domain-containing phosphohydrolase [Deinococcus misasensis]|uniref:HD domain-containing phosphohydrolase n=1 Tax=Deinococcus misasensis TaxID=392413 RepID=UPI000558B87B|nr:HD domain-containing phosphohydrolase [Deinococcus misasensis]